MKKYVRKKDHIASKIQDEIVMVDVDLGSYFTLNPVASDIWEIIDTPKSIEEIVTVLLREYDIDEETCTAEVHNFIDELSQLGLIVEQAG